MLGGYAPSSNDEVGSLAGLTSVKSPLTRHIQEELVPRAFDSLTWQLTPSPNLHESVKSTSRVTFVLDAQQPPSSASDKRKVSHWLRAMVSIYHMSMKFPTRFGVGELRSNPKESKQCYRTTVPFLSSCVSNNCL
ncbi:hypothetical protein GW17_00048131 [Ensete ventricosum]|nr:hypothetical protein GW17_00048131 [Ensete ventricosum]